MCDYSLHHVRSRPAKVGDRLTSRNFGTGTRGFAAAEDRGMAVCLLPGTELAFSDAVEFADVNVRGFARWKPQTLDHTTAVFRRVNENDLMRHHDALEFPDGRIVLLTNLREGQSATVLQLPAQPRALAGAEAEKPVAYAE